MADSSNSSSNGSSQKPFRVIGTRPIRHDGIEKVTGRAKYGADWDRYIARVPYRFVPFVY